MKEHFDNYENKMKEKLEKETLVIDETLSIEESEDNVGRGGVPERLTTQIFAEIAEFDAEYAKLKEKREREIAVSAEESSSEEKIETAAFTEEGLSKEQEALDFTENYLSKEDQEALRLGRELQERRKSEEEKKASKKKWAAWKRVAAAVVVVLLVGGVSVTSMGGKDKVVERAQRTFGNRNVKEVNSSKNEVKNSEDYDEEQAYQQIRDELGIEPVRIVLKDKDMQFKLCEIDSELRTACLIYQFGEKNVSFIINGSYTEDTWGFDCDDKEVDEYMYPLETIEVLVKKYDTEEGGKYTGDFEYRGYYYRITGSVEKSVFEEILECLHFS